MKTVRVPGQHWKEPGDYLIIEMTHELFEMLSDKFGGDKTLNEIRVMNQVIGCDHARQACEVSFLAETTGIAISTVRRVVGNLFDQGFLHERINPDDRRRTIITLGPRSERITDDIEEIRERITALREEAYKRLRASSLSSVPTLS